MRHSSPYGPPGPRCALDAVVRHLKLSGYQHTFKTVPNIIGWEASLGYRYRYECLESTSHPENRQDWQGAPLLVGKSVPLVQNRRAPTGAQQVTH